MGNIKIAGLAAIGLLTVTLASGNASAMPVMGIDPAVVTGTDAGASLDQVAWVCGPFRCHWVRPRPVFYGGPYYRPFGWHRGYGWRRW